MFDKMNHRETRNTRRRRLQLFDRNQWCIGQWWRWQWLYRVNTTQQSKLMNTNQQYDDDDFSASMKLGGGSSAGGGNGSSASVYSSKHVRAQLVRLSSTKKVKKKNKQ